MTKYVNEILAKVPESEKQAVAKLLAQHEIALLAKTDQQSNQKENELTDNNNLAKLLANNNLYDFLFNNIPLAFAFIELIGGSDEKTLDYRFLKINPAFTSITGYTAEELINYRIGDIFPNTEAHWLDQFHEVLQNKQPVFFDDYSEKLEIHFNVRAYYVSNNCIAVMFSNKSAQNHALQKQIQSYDFLRKVIDTLPIRVFWKDLKSVFQGANKSFLEDAGLKSVDELLSKSDYDLSWNNESASNYQKDDQWVMENDIAKLNYEENQIWKDNSQHNLKTSKLPLKNDKGEIIGVLGTYEDITDYNNLVKKLQQTQFTLDNIIDATYWFNQDGLLVYCNKAAKKSLGYSNQELINLHFHDILPDSSQELWKEFWKKIMIEKYNSIEQTCQRKDGSSFPVEVTNSYLKFDETELCCSVTRDITIRKQIQTELEESQQLLRTVIDTIPIRIFWKNKDSIYLCCNHYFATDCGLDSPAEIIGKNDFEIYSEDDAISIRAQDLKVYSSGKAKYKILNHHKKWHGEDKWFEINKLPLKDSRDNIFGIIGTYEDVSARKSLESQLMQTQFAIDSLSVPAIWCDHEGNLLYANDSASKLSGYPIAELLQMSIPSIDTANTPKHWHAFWEIFKVEKQLKIERIIRRKDGSIFNAELNTNYFKFDQKEMAFIIVNDVTERNRMQDAIKKRIVALTRPLDQAYNISFDDLFEIEEINQIQEKFAKATGVTAFIAKPDGSPITGLSNSTNICHDLFFNSPEQGQCCLRFNCKLTLEDKGLVKINHCPLTGLLESRMPIIVGDSHIANWHICQVRDMRMTIEEIRQKATEMNIDSKSLVDAMMKIPAMSVEQFERVAQSLSVLASQLSASAYQNIQQARFIAEETRRTAELKKLSTAIEQSLDIIIITDIYGTIEYVNPSFEKISGYSREEVIGRNPSILKSGRHTKAFYRDLWHTIKAKKNWLGILYNKNKKGDIYIENTTISPVLDPLGNIINFVAVKEDITQKVAQETQLLSAEKMEAVGQLAGGIAHDFNNIIQIITGFSELLLSDPHQSESAKQYLSEIRKASSHASDLTTQLLVFSRNNPVEFSEFDLNKEVLNCQKVISSTLGENIKLSSNLAKQVCAISGNFNQIQRLLVNLAVNARDAMTHGGTFCITTAVVNISEKHIQNNPNASHGDFICLTISDNGSGMPPEVITHIFEPFFTTKSLGKGTGLGLASVYGVVKSHNGWITVDSTLDVGTTFKIYFPAISSSNCDTIMEQKISEFDLLGHGERILVVEDDPVLIELSLVALTNSGYAIKTASSVAEAKKIWQAEEGNFDLLFTDIILPDSSGPKLAHDLLANKPNLPILLCSGYSGERIKQSGLEKDKYSFISKPFAIKDLLEKIKSLLTS